MDLFEIEDDYVPAKYLTDEEMQENTKYLKNHPLFWKQIPDNAQENQHIMALQSLMKDQDPDDLAENLNAQGSKKLKEKPDTLYFMKEAYKKYSEGISVGCPSAAINAKLHSNRAAINMKLKNYGKVIEDCKKCLSYDPDYVKAYFRYAKALNALKRYEETVKLLAPRKQVDLKESLVEAQKCLEQSKQKQAEKEDQKKNQVKQIEQYCADRKWKIVKRNKNDPLPQNAKLELIEGKLSIPLVVIYPEFSQFDLIASTFETQKLKQHLQELFQNPLPWDAKGEYALDTIEIFVEVAPEKMMKIPKQCFIKEIVNKVPLKESLEIQLVRPGNSYYQKFMSQNTFI